MLSLRIYNVKEPQNFSNRKWYYCTSSCFWHTFYSNHIDGRAISNTSHEFFWNASSGTPSRISKPPDTRVTSLFVRVRALLLYWHLAELTNAILTSARPRGCHNQHVRGSVECTSWQNNNKTLRYIHHNYRQITRRQLAQEGLHAENMEKLHYYYYYLDFLSVRYKIPQFGLFHICVRFTH